MRGLRGLAAAVTGASIALLAGCSSAAQMPEFAPGTWQNSAGDVSLTLLEDGTGETANLSYLVGDACPEGGPGPRYTGAVTWYWNPRGSSNIGIRLTDVEEGWRGFVAAAEGSTTPEWARLLTWPCYDGDNSFPEILFRLES